MAGRLTARRVETAKAGKHSDGGNLGGFKRSSQHRLYSLMAATRRALQPPFSSPASFSVGH